MLFMTGILRRSKPEESEDTLLTVFIATLAPILLGIFQLLYPNAPFYSLGYFLACYLLHVRVISKNREHADKAAIFHAISKTYYSMHLIDMEKDTVTRYIESPILTRLIKEANGAQQMINRVIMGTANDDYRQLMLDFVNLKTLSERMQGKPTISCEFIGRNYGWTRLSFISVETDGNLQNQIEGDRYFDGDETQRQLLQAVASLPARQRQVFNMRYYDEMSYEEISQILGTSVGALKASYHFAVERITQIFQKFERD